MHSLKYDDAAMWDTVAGQGGVTKAEWRAMIPRLREADRSLARLSRGKQGWISPGSAKDPWVKEVLAQAKKVRGSSRGLLVIGIGGSDLGARALLQSLGDPSKGVWLDVLSNPDPEYIAAKLDDAKEWLKETAVLVVSKSGMTLETMAIFSLVREKLKALKGDKHRSQIYVISDPNGNPLHELSKSEGYNFIPHALNIGGRFSILSSVGLFPAACAGIPITRVLKGAQDRSLKNAAQRFAALHTLAMATHGQGTHVLMPYSNALETFGDWYRQIWAESLGKNGKGPTPLAALGTIDQHSQVQLFHDGPNDKAYTFISVEKPRRDVRLPASVNRIMPGLGGKKLSEIMQASYKGTATALSGAQRPHGTITIPTISPETVGALAQFFMLATAYTGELMGVNTFDQPGVEAGKIETKRLLGLV